MKFFFLLYTVQRLLFIKMGFKWSKMVSYSIEGFFVKFHFYFILICEGKKTFEFDKCKTKYKRLKYITYNYN